MFDNLGDVVGFFFGHALLPGVEPETSSFARRAVSPIELQEIGEGD